MKKLLFIAAACLIAATMLMCLAACGSSSKDGKPIETILDGLQAKTKTETEKNNTSKTGPKESKEPLSTIEIEAGACIKQGCQVILANTNGTISVVEDSKGSKVEWRIYLSDDKLSDPTLLETTEPVLTGAGSFKAKGGQYIYVFCSANDLDADGAALLRFTGRHLTR